MCTGVELPFKWRIRQGPESILLFSPLGSWFLGCSNLGAIKSFKTCAIHYLIQPSGRQTSKRQKQNIVSQAEQVTLEGWKTRRVGQREFLHMQWSSIHLRWLSTANWCANLLGQGGVNMAAVSGRGRLLLSDVSSWMAELCPAGSCLLVTSSSGKGEGTSDFTQRTTY